MLNRFVPLGVAAAFVILLSGSAAPSKAAEPACGALGSLALAHIADALTAGSDAGVLKSVLADRDTFRSCGASWHDRISLDLIGADAADDAHQPDRRCELLAEAKHLASAREPGRAATIAKVASNCKT